MANIAAELQRSINQLDTPDFRMKQNVRRRVLPSSHSSKKGYGHEHLEEFGEWNVESIDLEEKVPSILWGAFKKPVLTQYMKPDGTIVRQAAPRRVDWSELFYDLVYVAIIADMTHEFARNPSFSALLTFGTVFSILWLSWRDCTIYIDWFRHNDMSYRIFLYIQMSLAVVLGATHPTASQALKVESMKHFALAALLLKVSVLVMYGFVAFFLKPVRKTMLLHNVGSMVVLVMYVVAFVLADLEFSATDIRYVWIAAALVDLLGWIAPIAVIRMTTWGDFQVTIPYNIEHITERFGLFVVVVIGEIMASAAFLASENTGYTPFLVAFCALLMAFSIQEWYFNLGNSAATLHAFRWTWQAGSVWFVLHLPLALATTLVGGGLGHIITASIASYEPVGSVDPHRRRKRRSFGVDAGGGSVAQPSTESSIWLVGVCMGVLIGLLTLVGLTHKVELVTQVARRYRAVFRLATAAVCMLLPLAFGKLEDHIIISIMAVVCLVGQLYEAYGASVKDSQETSVPQPSDDQSDDQEMADLERLHGRAQGASGAATAEQPGSRRGSVFAVGCDHVVRALGSPSSALSASQKRRQEAKEGGRRRSSHSSHPPHPPPPQRAVSVRRRASRFHPAPEHQSATPPAINQSHGSDHSLRGSFLRTRSRLTKRVPLG